MAKSNSNSLLVIDEVSTINNIIETNNSLKDDLLIGMWYSEDIAKYSTIKLKIKIEGVNNDSIQWQFILYCLFCLVLYHYYVYIL